MKNIQGLQALHGATLEHQLAKIFTKPLARDRFFYIRNELGILDESSIE